VDVGDVNLDLRPVEHLQGIEQCDGVKREAGGIDHDARHLAACFMQPVDQHGFGI
jgi:hypothetical protein